MKARVLSALALLVMLGFSVLTVAMLLEMRDETRKSETGAARNLLTAEADDIDRLLAVYDLSLRSTAALLRDAALAGASPRVQQLGLFDQNMVSGAFGPIRVIDPGGRVTHDSSTLQPSPPTTAELDALERHRDDPSTALFFSKPLRLGADRSGDIALSYRIADAHGGFAGIITGTLRLAYVSDQFRRLHLGPHDVVTLISTDGTILAHVPDTLAVGRTLAGSMNLRRFQARSSGDFEGRSSLDGTQRLYSFVHIGRWPLVIDVGISEHDLYASWRRRAWADGLSLLLMVATGLVLIAGLRQELRRRIGAEWEYKLLADHASDVILRLDRRLRLLYVSPSCRDYGYESEELLGGSPLDRVHPDDLGAVRTSMLRAQARGRDTEISYRLRCRDGHYVWVEGRYNHIAREGGFIAIIRDISRRKEAEAALELANADLERLAATDALTGLANRRAFDDGLMLEWRRALRAGSVLSVVLIDVDQFKLFNDRYGHPEGDAVLRAVAETIRHCIRRPGDLAARYGGEEFVVILPNTDRFGAIDVSESIRRGVAALAIPHEDGVGGRITISLGLSTTHPVDAGLDSFGLDAPGPAGLVAAADAALYDAKHAGRNQVRAGSASALAASHDA